MIYKNVINNVINNYDNIDLTNCLSDNFFSKFDNPKEEVLLVINTFPLRDKVLLYKKYGKNSKENVNTYENTFINETILPKLYRSLSKLGVSREFIYLRDIINEDEELISMISKKCNLYKYLVERFGYDLKQPMLIYSEYKEKAISKEKKAIIIREINKYKGIKRVEIIKPFYERFIKFKRNDETYEDFIKRIKSIVYAHLNEILLNEVILTFNEDLLNVLDYGRYAKGKDHTKNLLKAYNIIKLYLINQNKKITNPRLYAPIELVLKDEICLEELLEELAKINIRTIKLLKLKYGEDYLHPNVIETLSKEDNKYLVDAISVAKKRIKQNMYNCFYSFS